VVAERVNSEKLPRFYVLGYRGYLGSNIATHLNSQGFEVRKIDPRITDLRHHSLSDGDWVVDSSRLKEFDEPSLLKDSKVNREVLSWADSSKAKLLRIGSILELQNEDDVSPYIKWSCQRTKELTKANSSGKFGTLIVPNIYGGDKSTSILDLILKKYSSGEIFDLEHPFVFRDFLHIRFLLESIDDLVTNAQTFLGQTNLISSGVSYQVGSIRDYIHTRDKSQLVSKANDYIQRIDCREFPDKLLNYVENY
jgi:hypothetical protein